MRIRASAAVLTLLIFVQCAKTYKKSEVAEPVEKLAEINRRAADLFNEAKEEYDKKYFYEAAELFNKVLEVKPDHKEAQYMHYLAQGRHRLRRGSVIEMWDAILAFGYAASAKPEAAEPYYYMAQAYAKKDKRDYDTPIEHYKKVIDLSPGSELAQESLKKIEELAATKEKMEKFFKKKKKGGSGKI